MTAIQHFPEELLFLIFDGFEEDELMECKLVCRAWYPPAHILFLDDTGLFKRNNIEQFIESFDINPDPKYLKAVRRLDIVDVDLDDPDYRLNMAILRKLFFRFPRLEVVEFSNSNGLLQNFNDRICKTILKNCPKLTSFVLWPQGDQAQYCKMLRKVRLLVTTIDLNKIRSIVDIPKFLTTFPRLRDTMGDSPQLDNFTKYLPVLENLPEFKDLTIYQAQEDNQNFMERYMASKSRDERDKLISRLAEINKLDWTPGTLVCLASIRFVAQYLTGLNRIKILSYANTGFNAESKASEFHNLILGLVHTIDHCDIRLKLWPFDILQTITSTLFDKSVATKTLQLTLVDDNAATMNIKSDKQKSTRHVNILIPKESVKRRISSSIFECDNPLENIDEFILKIGRQLEIPPLNSKVYGKALEEISSSLKKITFDVPANVFEVDDCRSVKHPQVETLTIQSSPGGRFQKLLDGWAMSFPKLQELHLSYWSGVWGESIGEFQVELGKYSLQKLIVDTTPVKIKMIEKKLPIQNGFLVVLVQILQSNERHMFKVALNLSSATRIDTKDLDGLVRGEDYYRLNVTTRSLQCLQLKLYKNSTDDSVDEQYLRENTYHVKTFTRLTILATGE